MARPKRTITANQRRAILSRYPKGYGLVALSKDFEISIPVIRRVLVEGGVKIRGKGRPVGVA